MNVIKYLNLTDEQAKAYRKNYLKAKAYFDLPKGFILHHKDIELRKNDIERYIKWLPEDLVPMTQAEHASLHNKLDKANCVGMYSDKHLDKLSKQITAYNKSDLCRQRIIARQNKKVLCVETGVVYDSVKIATELTKISHIDRVARGESHTAGGYHWIYADKS